MWRGEGLELAFQATAACAAATASAVVAGASAVGGAVMGPAIAGTTAAQGAAIAAASGGAATATLISTALCCFGIYKCTQRVRNSELSPSERIGLNL